MLPGGTTFLNVSVHRFADAESAANAMVFFSDQVIFGQGLQEVEPPAVGETARLLRRRTGWRAPLRAVRAGRTDHVSHRRFDGAAPMATPRPMSWRSRARSSQDRHSGA